MRQTLLIIALSISFCSSFSQTSKNPLLTLDAEAQKRWVDSVYQNLTLKQKIGQLFMVRAFSKGNKAHIASVEKLIKTYHIGGLIFSSGGPVRQAKLNNKFQAWSKIPLLIGMDAEWGLSMRLDSTFAFPWNMTLGAVKNNILIEQTGRQLGEHCKRIGVHFNFAPVVDINTNPKNPIIGNRSFGEDRDNVTQKALAFMKGMQSAGVLANAKHFPGHGDTDSDSHKTLPTIHFNEKRIDSVELYPYKKLINQGLSSVMVAHLNVPSMESRDGFPSSLSKYIVTDVLKEKLGFKGLIYTDALEMKGVSNFSEPGDIDLAAFLAGNDVLLISEDIPKAVSKLITAYESGVISEARLAHSVKKILQAKYKVGLNNYRPVAMAFLHEDLNRTQDHILYERLIEEAITVVKNENTLLPFKHLEDKKIAYVKFGDASGNTFLNALKKYTGVTQIASEHLEGLLTKLKPYNTVVIGLHRSNDTPWKAYKFTKKELTWLNEIAKNHRVILDVFVKPYALLDIKSVANIEAIVVSYQNSEAAQKKSAEILFGALAAKGKLPVSITPHFKVGQGRIFNSIKRLGYTIPERVGMSSFRLKKVDSLAKYAVNAKMTPGIQLLIAKNGKVFYNKNFGKQTYKGNKKIKFNTLFDVASLTKITATLPLIMELVDRGQLSLNDKLGDLLPEYKTSNKKNVTLKSMLSHYARLKPWIPFYVKTLDSVTKKPDLKYYRKTLQGKFNLRVTDNLYMRSDYKDSIQGIIKESDLLSRLRYRYSDMPYYILKKYIEIHYQTPLDVLANSHFYSTLGANYTTYNPLDKFPKSQIAPTEQDDYFRYQTVHGYVHDMGAAMQGGIGGHAGVFSNANDIAKIMQLYLQKGYYGGKRYFDSQTMDIFNTCYYCDKKNRRGVGFDKPQLGESGPTCGCLSMTSFGHSGFTGTYAWADPEEDLVYIFLANRTFPKAGKNKLLRENIRTDIQQAIYNAIIK